MKSKEKRTWGGDNAHPNVRLKVINSETKRLTHHITDRIAEQAALVIVLVSSELRTHLNNLQTPRFSFA